MSQESRETKEKEPLSLLVWKEWLQKGLLTKLCHEHGWQGSEEENCPKCTEIYPSHKRVLVWVAALLAGTVAFTVILAYIIDALDSWAVQ